MFAHHYYTKLLITGQHVHYGENGSTGLIVPIMRASDNGLSLRPTLYVSVRGGIGRFLTRFSTLPRANLYKG